MKNKKLCLAIILGFLIVFSQICVVCSEADAIQDKALAFIEDVLPIDSAKWKIKHVVDSSQTDTLAGLYINNISVAENDKVFIYFLASKVGTPDGVYVFFIIKDGAFRQGVINIDNSPSYLQTYRRFVTSISLANVSDFLVTYSQWSGLDSTKMIELLSSVDITENAKVSSTGIAMTINHNDVYTDVCWVFEGSTEFTVSFRRDFPVSFFDERSVSSNAPTHTSTESSSPPTATGNSPISTPILSDWGPIATIMTSIAIVTISLLVVMMYLRKKHFQLSL
jgi:hypothetical protein